MMYQSIVFPRDVSKHTRHHTAGCPPTQMHLTQGKSGLITEIKVCSLLGSQTNNAVIWLLYVLDKA